MMFPYSCIFSHNIHNAVVPLLSLFILFWLFRYWIFFFVMAIPLRCFNLMCKNRTRQYNNETGDGSCIHQDQNANRLTKKLKKTLPFRSILLSSQKLLIQRIKLFPSHFVRDFFYKKVLLVEKLEGSIVYFGCEIRSGYNLHIGKNSIVGDNSILDAGGGIFIGNNVNISSEVRMWTGSHDVNSSSFEYKNGSISVGDRAWISSNAIILGNVKIGEGAVVCANAVVTKDVPDFTIVAGVPARQIGKRSTKLKYEFKNKGLFL